MKFVLIKWKRDCSSGDKWKLQLIRYDDEAEKPKDAIENFADRINQEYNWSEKHHGVSVKRINKLTKEGREFVLQEIKNVEKEMMEIPLRLAERKEDLLDLLK